MPRVNIYSRLIQVIITVSLSLTVSPSHAKPQVKSEHIGAWLNHYVMPSYGALHEANLNLQRQASLLCSELSLEALDDMQPYLTQAMEAYAYRWWTNARTDEKFSALLLARPQQLGV